MKHILILSCLTVGLSGCSGMSERLGLGGGADATAPSETAMPGASAGGQTGLAPATASPPPTSQARTADALDTTTPEQRAAASAPATAGGRALGTTVASLGSATEPGLWIKTPLVEAEAQGRVTNPATGKSSTVTLIPIAGSATAGSRMSLAALRLIGASLTDLTTVELSIDG